MKNYKLISSCYCIVRDFTVFDIMLTIVMYFKYSNTIFLSSYGSLSSIFPNQGNLNLTGAFAMFKVLYEHMVCDQYYLSHT